MKTVLKNTMQLQKGDISSYFGLIVEIKEIFNGKEVFFNTGRSIRFFPNTNFKIIINPDKKVINLLNMTLNNGCTISEQNTAIKLFRKYVNSKLNII